jgi:hypothetical protein
MARYRIHRIRETPKEQFRWAAHTGGTALVKSKDYEADAEVDAATPYAAWSRLQTMESALSPGDVLEIVNDDGPPGDLQIFKYIGFEPAKWWTPEPKSEQKGVFAGSDTSVAITSDSYSA